MPSEASSVLQALTQYQNAVASSSSGNPTVPATHASKRVRESRASNTPAKRLRTERPSHGTPRMSLDDSAGNPSAVASNHDLPSQQEFTALLSRSFYRTDFDITVKDGLVKLGLRGLDDVIPGMQVRLMRHQIIGVSWMVHRERETRDKGGILADEMGLGKTVQMIATMTLNAADPYSDGPRATLIVVPVALLHQWKEEIETKTNDMFRVHIQHGRTKLKYAEELEEFDVVITSYHTLNFDFTVPERIDELERDRYIAKHGGVLSRIRWYRVILDEAQVIRNRETCSSQAVARLDAKYRWMLTGTPITNTLTDLYGLLRFGRFRPWNDWYQFDGYVSKVQMEDPPLAGHRAQEILRPLLLRRTKSDELEGQPLLVLPPKDIEVVLLDFSPDERSIYEIFQKRAQIQLNRFIQRNDLTKNNHAVLVMILRLRQLCCHPNLILCKGQGYEDPTLLTGGNADDRALDKATKTMGKAWVNEIQKRFARRAKMKQLDISVDGKQDDLGLACPSCLDFFMDGNGRVLECGHELCSECLMDLVQAPLEHDNDFQQGTDAEITRAEKEFETAVRTGARPCPTCRKYFNSQKVFNSAAFEPDDDEDDGSDGSLYGGTGRVSGNSAVIDLDSDSDVEMPDLSELLTKRHQTDDKSKGKQKASKNGIPGSDGVDDDAKGEGAFEKSSEEVLATWKRGNLDLEPSAKMVALVEHLKQWDLDSHYQDKVICYSQWTSMLDLVEALLQRERLKYLRYDGKMNKEAREAAITTFKRSDGPRLILISTKSGSVGLNLVVANRVVNLDLSWNYASEAQAYDRVHRVGQTKNVFVKRFVIRDTIEERMLRVQDLKLSLADAALGEGTGGQKLTKLSVKEIRALFGMENRF